MSEVSSNLEVLFNKMENFVSTKTVIGDPITIGKVILVPLIDVSFGVGAGAKQNKANKVGSDTKNGSAAGLGAKMSPSAILVINDGTVNVNDQNSVNKLIDMIPSIASKIKSFGGSDDEETEETEDSVEIIE
jgi:uncharacterized spore protein YtfJ